jgi:hypothetical protein
LLCSVVSGTNQSWLLCVRRLIGKVLHFLITLWLSQTVVSIVGDEWNSKNNRAVIEIAVIPVKSA